MTTYLLLRDNKESGPYSFEDIRQKGFKAYDLVWIEGKSAAWRYPSEVEEFKAFAPAVEEQPFDRFFKRPSQNEQPAPQNPQINPQVNPHITLQPRPSEPSTVPGKRIIYVTLPAGRSIPASRPPAAAVAAVAAVASAVAQPPIRANVAPIGEEKFSQTRDDMWKSAVEINPRSQSSPWKRVLQPVAAVVCILALLAAGIFIGLSINRESIGISKKIVKETALTPVSHTERTLHTEVPVTSEASPAGQPSSTSTQGSGPVTQSAIPVAQTRIPVTPVLTPPPSNTSDILRSNSGKPASTIALATIQKKKTNTPRQNLMLADKAPIATPARDSSATGLPIVHREAIHRGDETFDKDAIKSNIANLLSVGSNTYTVGTFGGISDLQVTVSNRSIYPIDLVVVEVQYVQANKKTFKTENMYFRGIAPGAALMQEAPKSTRGIKVQYKITLINSKELGLSFSAL
jgi:hypothetical protein